MTRAAAAQHAACELNPRKIRQRLGLNQAEFWSRIGVTQSGGSRYESGRAMPKPVKELLRVVHAEGIDLARVRREDIDLLDFLKATQPGLYESLRASLKSAEAVAVSGGNEANPAADLPPGPNLRRDPPADLGLPLA